MFYSKLLKPLNRRTEGYSMCFCHYYYYCHYYYIRTIIPPHTAILCGPYTHIHIHTYIYIAGRDLSFVRANGPGETFYKQKPKTFSIHPSFCTPSTLPSTRIINERRRIQCSKVPLLLSPSSNIII